MSFCLWSHFLLFQDRGKASLGTWDCFSRQAGGANPILIGVMFQNKSCIFTCKQCGASLFLLKSWVIGIAMSYVWPIVVLFVVRELFLSCHGDLWLETRAGFSAVRKWGRETYVYIKLIMCQEGLGILCAGAFAFGFIEST